MSQLKPSFVQEILTALGKSKFSPEDFSLSLPESGRLLAKITFLHKPEYFFELSEDNKRDQITIDQRFGLGTRTEHVNRIEYSIKTVPGRFKTVELSEISDLGDALPAVPQWCDNIRADLYALMPVQDPLDQLRAKLQKDLDALIDEPTAFFNEKELSVVDGRFNKLYDDIAQLREQHSITKQQLETLRKEIDEFKQSARSYPKGMWAKITGNKLIRATGTIFNSPEGRKFLFQQVARVLGLPDN